MLHPASGLGVHRVSDAWFPLLPQKPRAPRRLPRDAGSDPSKGSPRQQPYRITAAVALLSLPLAPLTPRGVLGSVLGDDAPIRLGEPPLRHRFAGPRAEARGPACTVPMPCLPRLGSLLPPIPEGAGAGEQPTSRLCSTDESVAALPPLPVTKRSFLPWALVPFKVLRLPLQPRYSTWETHCTLTRSGTRLGPRLDGVSSSRGPREIPPWVPLLRRRVPLHAAEQGRRWRTRRVPFQRLSETSLRDPACPPVARGTADGPGPPESVRLPKFVSLPVSQCRCRRARPEGLGCRQQPRGARYRPSWGL